MIVKTNEVVGKNLIGFDNYQNLPKMFISLTSLVGFIKLKVKNGEYTASCNLPLPVEGQGAGLFIYPNQMPISIASSTGGVYNNQPRTISVTNETIYIGGYFDRRDTIHDLPLYGHYLLDSLLNKNYWIQLEESSTATSYEPFIGYKSYMTADSNKLMEEMN